MNDYIRYQIKSEDKEMLVCGVIDCNGAALWNERLAKA